MIRIDVRLLSAWLKITKKLIFCIRNKQMVDRWFKLILIKNLNLNCLPYKRKVRKPAFIFRVNNTPNLFIKNCSNGHSFQALIAKMVASIKSMTVGESWKERGILGLLTKILQRLRLKNSCRPVWSGREEMIRKEDWEFRISFSCQFLDIFILEKLIYVYGWLYYSRANSTSTLKTFARCWQKKGDQILCRFIPCVSLLVPWDCSRCLWEGNYGTW